MEILFLFVLLPFLCYTLSSLILDASLKVTGFNKKWGFCFKKHGFVSFFVGLFLWIIIANIIEDFSPLTLFSFAILMLVFVLYLVGTYHIEHPEERSKKSPPDILDDDF